MNSIQKKLVSSIYKLWEAAQKYGERFRVQDIPDVGFVAASSHVLIRLPKDCPHPFRADKEEGRIADVMKDYLTGKDSVNAFDTGDMSTFGRNLVAKKIAYGTDGKSVFVPFVAFDALAEGMNDWAKGTRVWVVGRFQTTKYEKNGETRYSSNVVATGAGTAIFPFKKKDGNNSGFNGLGTEVDEEIPF